MLTHEEIVKAVAKAATQFSLERVSYFGSYADGNATEESDLDVLVEFSDPPVSLLTMIGLKCYLEDELNTPVDVINSPLPKKALIKIERAVPVYERP